MIIWYIFLGVLTTLLQSADFYSQYLYNYAPLLTAVVITQASIYFKDNRIFVVIIPVSLWIGIFSHQPALLTFFNFSILAFFVFSQLLIINTKKFWGQLFLAFSASFVYVVIDYITFCIGSWRISLGTEVISSLINATLINTILIPLLALLSNGVHRVFNRPSF